MKFAWDPWTFAQLPLPPPPSPLAWFHLCGLAITPPTYLRLTYGPNFRPALQIYRARTCNKCRIKGEARAGFNGYRVDILQSGYKSSRTVDGVSWYNWIVKITIIIRYRYRGYDVERKKKFLFHSDGKDESSCFNVRHFYHLIDKLIQ